MRYGILLAFFLFSLIAESQIPTGYQHWENLSETEHRIHTSKPHHTHIRPLSPFLDSTLVTLTADSSLLKGDGLRYTIKPVADLMGGGSASPSFGVAGFGSLGAHFTGVFNDRFYLNTGYQFGYLYFPDHLQLFAKHKRTLPGLGEVTPIGDAFGTHYWTASAGMRIGKFFNLDIGRDKHFWGNGYRSMILSNNAAPYYYGRFTTKVWKIKYTNLFTGMDNLDELTQERRRKYMALHSLSWNINHRVNLTLYEAIVWQAQDTLSQRGFEPAYLNPFIFYRPVEFAQGSADNALLGLEMRIEITTKVQLYTQLYFDEFLMAELRRGAGWWGNKFAWQIGAKSWDLFKDSLMLQTEFNLVRPFTYTHGSEVQSYGHLNQSLAHPLETNFIEWVSRAKWIRENEILHGTFILGSFGRDKEGLNYGGDVFTSYADPWQAYDNRIAQGEKNTLLQFIGEYERPLDFYGLSAVGGIGVRKVFNSLDSPFDAWLMVGVRTSLVRPYRDI
ncbi:MAG: hypothetical protein MK081_06275 [Flavobacteriales bacterium]|nr:hypothetical protein [Flavobacteriales bacterium]